MKRFVIASALCASLLGMSACANKQHQAEPIGRTVDLLHKASVVPMEWQVRLSENGNSLADFEVDAGAPFTADEIRDYTMKGLYQELVFTQYNLETGESESESGEQIYVDADKDSVSVEMREIGTMGGMGMRQPWSALAAHATFAPNTLRYERTMKLPALDKAVDCWVYIEKNPMGMDRVMVFPKSHPGMPHMFDGYVNGQLVIRARLTSLTPGAKSLYGKELDTGPSANPEDNVVEETDAAVPAEESPVDQPEEE